MHLPAAGQAVDAVGGEVGAGQHRDHARRRAHRVEIQRNNFRMRGLAQPERGIQRTGEFRNIVDIDCFAGDVQRGRFVRHADAGSGFASLLTGRIFHQADTAKTLTASVASVWPGRVSK